MSLLTTTVANAESIQKWIEHGATATMVFLEAGWIKTSSLAMGLSVNHFFLTILLVTRPSNY